MRHIVSGLVHRPFTPAFISDRDSAPLTPGRAVSFGATGTWATHEVVDAFVSTDTTLNEPPGHINIHTRNGSSILLHKQLAYTIAETRHA